MDASHHQNTAAPRALSPTWTQHVDEAIDRLFDRMVELRRHIHAHPEPSGEEQETSQHLYGLLSDEGFNARIGPEGRGVVVDCGPENGRRIGVRADIDALKIQDRKTVPYRSQRPGVMHACGHDAHSATLFGALLALKSVGSEGRLPWPVTVRGIFQPSEETATGALEMIAYGALAGVEAILAAHVDPTRPVGRIAIRPGVLTANCDAMCLAISGQGGHAARPHESKDPIAAAAQLISTLYQFVPRATDSQDAVVVTIGQVIGGENPNVIPEHIELRGTLRTLDQRVRQATVEHVRQLARGISEVSGTKIEVSFESGVGSVENDPLLTRLIGDTAVDVVGEDNLEEILRPSMGSEDFAAYLGHVPGAMFRLGSGYAAGESTSLHTSNFDIDERAMKIGARIFARAVVAWSSPELNSY